jgi:hypothetical protein
MDAGPWATLQIGSSILVPMMQIIMLKLIVNYLRKIFYNLGT